MMSNDDLGRNGTALPQESPLPHNNRSATDAGVYYVIATAGTYYLEVSASADASTGKYDVDTMVARPGTEALPAGSRQILFLDFDVATGLNPNFGVQILNSRDDADHFGNDPLVSRVVVGGTQ